MFRSLRSLSLLALGLLSACNDDGSTEGGPRSGLWRYVDGGVVGNSCGTEDVVADPNTNFQLTNNGDGTFTVAQLVEDDFTCTVEGSSFTCPERLGGSETIDGGPLGVATLTYTVRVEGTLDGTSAMSGTQIADITCEGAACAAGPSIGITLPCQYSVAFTADI